MSEETVIRFCAPTLAAIKTYTRQSTNTGEMATFVNDDLLTIQSSIDGIIEKRIALRAHEPVTVFAETLLCSHIILTLERQHMFYSMQIALLK